MRTTPLSVLTKDVSILIWMQRRGADTASGFPLVNGQRRWSQFLTTSIGRKRPRHQYLLVPSATATRQAREPYVGEETGCPEEVARERVLGWHTPLRNTPTGRTRAGSTEPRKTTKAVLVFMSSFCPALTAEAAGKREGLCIPVYPSPPPENPQGSPNEPPRPS